MSVSLLECNVDFLRISFIDGTRYMHELNQCFPAGMAFRSRGMLNLELDLFGRARIY